MNTTEKQQPKNQGSDLVDRNAIRSIVLNSFSCVVFSGGSIWALYEGELNWLYLVAFMAISVLSGMDAYRVFLEMDRREAPRD